MNVEQGILNNEVGVKQLARRSPVLWDAVGRESERELEKLFQSLMQRAFRGELFQQPS